MCKIAIIGCEPEIVWKDGGEITLRFKGGAEERWLFEQAVEETHRTPKERAATYAMRHGLDQTAPVETD